MHRAIHILGWPEQIRHTWLLLEDVLSLDDSLAYSNPSRYVGSLDHNKSTSHLAGTLLSLVLC
jgi:hypothetical protein